MSAGYAKVNMEEQKVEVKKVALQLYDEDTGPKTAKLRAQKDTAERKTAEKKAADVNRMTSVSYSSLLKSLCRSTCCGVTAGAFIDAQAEEELITTLTFVILHRIYCKGYLGVTLSAQAMYSGFAMSVVIRVFIALSLRRVLMCSQLGCLEIVPILHLQSDLLHLHLLLFLVPRAHINRRL
jgi:hypothetical protein